MTTHPTEASAESGAPPSEALRVLGAFAHPDDETLTAGGLLAWLARTAQVHVVTATRGERGEVIPGDIAHLEGDGPGLAAVREAELAQALTALGVHQHHFLDALAERERRYVDSGMQWNGGSRVRAIAAADAGFDSFSKSNAETAAQTLADHLREVKPHLILIDEPGGGYGHPDHVRMHEVTMRAAELAAQTPGAGGQGAWQVPVISWVVRAESTVRAAQEWLARSAARPRLTTLGRTLTLPEPSGELASIVKPDAAIDVIVDASSVAGQVAAAMRAHRSQIQDVTLVSELLDPDGEGTLDQRGGAVGWFALSNEILQPLHSRVGLRVAPGWGSATELRAALAAAEARHAPGEVAEPEVGPESPGWYAWLTRGFVAVVGVAVGAVGTTFHRWEPPFGIIMAVALVISAGILARTFADKLGTILYVIAVMVALTTMAYVRPGGDVIVTGEPIGTAWLMGACVAVLVPLFAPRKWFHVGY